MVLHSGFIGFQLLSSQPPCLTLLPLMLERLQQNLMVLQQPEQRYRKQERRRQRFRQAEAALLKRPAAERPIAHRHSGSFPYPDKNPASLGTRTAG